MLRVAGADQRRREHRPIDEVPDPVVERVDRAAQSQQKTHRILPNVPATG